MVCTMKPVFRTLPLDGMLTNPSGKWHFAKLLNTSTYKNFPHSLKKSLFLHPHYPFVQEMRNASELKPGEVRLGVVQWLVKPFSSVEAFLTKVEQQVQSFANYGVDFVLYPEYFSLPLLTLFKGEERERLLELGSLADRLEAAFAEMAQTHQVNIIAGSMPSTHGDGELRNVSFLCRRNGSVERYYKIHLTPHERNAWHMTPGNEMGIYDTDCGRIGIQTCYDVEFPELGRLYAEQGVQMLFVPFSTDSQEGFYRVRHCAVARAIENECYVAIAGCVGYLPEVGAVEFQYGESAVFTPSDYAFPTGSIKSILPANVESIIVSDVNLELLNQLHHHGSVRNLKDRRKDLYQLKLHSNHSPNAHEYQHHHLLGPAD